MSKHNRNRRQHNTVGPAQRPVVSTSKDSMTFQSYGVIQATGQRVAFYSNRIYACAVYPPDSNGVGHVSVQRKDRAPARDWRELQQIKNDIFGAERVAVEIYPAESNLVDITNTTHLWVLPEGQDLGFGMKGRVTSYDPDCQEIVKSSRVASLVTFE